MSESVKRYFMCDQPAEMVENKIGAYVHWIDYEKLQKENVALKAKIESLQGGYCTCEILSNYHLFVEGDDLRHNQCGKLLHPNVRGALFPNAKGGEALKEAENG